MKKLIIFVVAFVAAPMIAHAEPISLAIGNAIFSGLYSVGISGALANFIANSAGIFALAGATVGDASFSRAGK